MSVVAIQNTDHVLAIVYLMLLHEEILMILPSLFLKIIILYGSNFVRYFS